MADERDEAKKGRVACFLERWGVMLAVVVVIAVVASSVWLTVYLWRAPLEQEPLKHASAVGDASAPIGAAFSLGALVAALIAVMLQAKELKEQRRELRASVAALTRQAAEAEESNKHAKAQLAFEKEQAVLANVRADEAHAQQRALVESASQRERSADLEKFRRELRTLYGDWLGDLDAYLASVESFGRDRASNALPTKLGEIGKEFTERTVTALHEESRSFTRLRLFVGGAALAEVENKLRWYRPSWAEDGRSLSETPTKLRAELRAFSDVVADEIARSQPASVSDLGTTSPAGAGESKGHVAS